MKATLIKLDTKVVDIPDHRPVWRELVREGMRPLEANYKDMPPTAIPVDVKTVDYRLLRIRGRERGENGMYMVNDEMWHTAMPIIDDVIRQELEPLNRENMELKIAVAKMSDNIASLKNSWWERFKRFFRLHNWLKTKIRR